MLTIKSLYKGINPLWARQIPYTMMKFASFETIVEAMYGYLPKKKAEYSKLVQTEVSFAGGYAGEVSLPDNSTFCFEHRLTLMNLFHSWNTLRHGLSSCRCHGQQIERNSSP